jgi:ParB-like chromosome segregation protein Spo0J
MAKGVGPLARPVGRAMEIPVNLIDGNPKNYNKQPKTVFAKLVESIREFGFVDPVIVREKSGGRYEVIGGEHRTRAAQVLRMETVPAINVGRMDDVTAARLLIVLNETKGQGDNDMLSALVTFIKEEGGEDALQVLPYSDAQLADMIDEDIDDDDFADEEAESAPPEALEVKIKGVDIANMLELGGVSQDDLKKLAIVLRKWRQTKSAEMPAYMHLIMTLKKDT